MKYISRYWAKTGDDGSWHPVAYHNLDTAAAMAALLRHRPGLLSLLASMLKIDTDSAAKLAVWMMAMHDIGKCSELFQHKATPFVHTITGQKVEQQSGYFHADGSMAFWDAHKAALTKMPNGGPCSGTLKALTVLFRSIAGHHGAPVKSIGYSSAKLITPKSDMLAFVADWTKIIAPTIAVIKESDAKNASWLLAGLAVVADWIGSNPRWFPYSVRCSCEVEKPLPDLATYWTDAEQKANRAIIEAGMAAVPLRKELTLSDLFPKITCPTPLQKALSDLDISAGAGLCIVEDLTGSGKTEGALILAQRMIATGQADGVYIALPTGATSNGMYGRINLNERNKPGLHLKYFAVGPEPSLVLAHSDRRLNDAYADSVLWSQDDVQKRYSGEDEVVSSACSAWIADAARKALLADFGVGTIDQAILGVLPNKFQSLRIAGLARKVVILDEIHCYDTYMTEEICGLLRFLGMLQCPVIALSATVPKSLRQKLLDAYRDGAGWTSGSGVIQKVDYPLITWMTKDKPISEIPTGFRDGIGMSYPVRLVSDESVVIDHLINAAESGCSCWIRNTVGDAARAADIIRAKAPHLNVLLFHSRYCKGDRAVIEKEVVRRFGEESSDHDRRGWIVIATQVIEQSLDIDFDAMVTDLAPIESIIQRGGRLQRHRRRYRRHKKILLVYGPQPVAAVSGSWFSSVFPGGGVVYPVHAPLWLTAHILADAGQLSLKTDARRLLEFVYADSSCAPDQITARDGKHLARLEKHGVMGQQAVLNCRVGYDRTAGEWDDDVRTPTRLGDSEISVRLAVRTSNGYIVPWSTDGKYHQKWIKSTLTIPYRWMSEAEQSGEYADRISEIKRRWPKHERGIPLIVAYDRNAVTIHGIRDGSPVAVRYTPILGAEKIAVV